MANHCIECGAEILTGMRFCRFCGAATGALAQEKAETRQFPSKPSTQQHPRQGTQPVYIPPQAPVPYGGVSLEPARRRKVWPWVVGSVLLLLGFIIGGAGYGIYRLVQTPGVEIQETDRGIVISKDGQRITIGIGQEGQGIADQGDVVTRTIPFASGGTFSMDVPIGDIKITSWDQKEIHIQATKHGGSERQRDQLDFNVDVSRDNTLILSTKSPPDSRAHMDYEIKVPHQINLEKIATNVGFIEVKGIQGRVRAENQTDHVSINGIMGDIAVATKSGHVDIKSVQGSVGVSTISGDIQVAQVMGTVNADTVSGNITAQLVEGADARDVAFQTVSGDISIQCDRGFNADLTFSTTTGDLNVQGDVQVAVEDRPGRKTAQGRVGKGGGRTVQIRTVSGDVKVSQ